MANKFFIDVPIDPGDDAWVSGFDEMMDLFADSESNGTLWDYVEGNEPARPGGVPTDEFRDQPEPIRRLVAMVCKDRWGLYAARSFYEEALAMATYTDSAPIVPFVHYYPMYSEMSIKQLRAYFTVRTLLRQGKHPEVPQSYLFIYIYETLMQVGIHSAEHGYEILADLRRAYSGVDDSMFKSHLTRWMKDYVVWNGLEAHYADEFPDECDRDRLVQAIHNPNAPSDEQLQDCLKPYLQAYGYNTRHSMLFKRHHEEAVEALVYVLRRLCAHLQQRKRRQPQWPERKSYSMFMNAVFYQPRERWPDNVVRTITSDLSYACSNNLWEVRQGAPLVEMMDNRRMLSAVLRRTDEQVRHAIGFATKLKPKPVDDAQIDRCVVQAVRDWAAMRQATARERRERQRRQELEQARAAVQIDLSNLGHIRRDAAAVQAALLEGTDDETPTPTVQPAAPPQAAPAPSEEQQDKTLLALLLAGADYGEQLRSMHVPQGVVMERINMRLMDRLGDTAIEENEHGRLAIVEDYREELAAYCNE